MNLYTPRLKWKIFAFLLGFCFLLLVMLWLFQTVFLDAFYRHIRVMEVRRSAAAIVHAVNTQNAERENINEIIRDISDINDISVNIIDLEGRSLLSASPRIGRREEITSLMERAIESEGEIYEYISIPGNQSRSVTSGRRAEVRNRQPVHSLIYVRIANNSLYEQYAIIIRAIISPVDATVTTLRHQFYYISGIILFLSVILAIIIAKHVAKPIEEITKSAMILARGSYDTYFTGKGYKEIAVLSDTLNKAASELSRVEYLRRELLANVSHDLRTPLALIYSNAEMMHDFPKEITPEQTQTIMDETKRLAALVNDVLDISMMENDMEKIDLSRYNLTQSILEIIESIKQLLSKEKFEITFSYDSDIYVNADKAKIDRVFYNLLINAVNYSSDNRNILVEQAIADNRVRISVIDYGEGIGEIDLPFIWDRYYKSGKTHKRAITGSGLGLSIVKKIIDIHGGKYGVVSEAGKGSTFWFEIQIV